MSTALAALVSADELAIRQRLKDDFAHYGRKCLRIRTKSGELLPLEMNRAQQHIHAAAEAQLAATGKVRANVLKGRQQGASTYITGRGYWKATHRRGFQVFILTHELAATDNLFDMVSRYHENAPALVKPHTGTANAKELRFDLMDSGYQVSTAGSKGTGRSGTYQFFHGSEVAFWPHAHTHNAGVLQAVPDMPGTEIWRESTSDGPGNLFHEAWLQAERGHGDFVNIFVPWWWQDEYRREAVSLEGDEADYAEAYGVPAEAMAWRRRKIADDFSGDAARFAREYPASPADAFSAATEAAFIPPVLVAAARQARCEAVGPKLGGVDVARFGDDATAFVTRQGRVAYGLEKHHQIDTMQVTGLVKLRLDRREWDHVFVDVVGIGAGVVDRLKEMGYADRIIAVNGGERAFDDEHYSNRRAEMYGEMRDWLRDAPCQVPDDEELQSDMCSVRYRYTSKGQYRLELKEEQKKRIGRSPDVGDALALTFAQPVSSVSFTDILPHETGGDRAWMA